MSAKNNLERTLKTLALASALYLPACSSAPKSDGIIVEKYFPFPIKVGNGMLEPNTKQKEFKVKYPDGNIIGYPVSNDTFKRYSCGDYYP